MRIALIPLDSRPPSWQFPQRIAAIAGVELLRPSREMLGTLHKGADQRVLLEWLVNATADADAVVISWDALVYGGLVQSRTEGEPLHTSDLVDALSSIDWKKCHGYLWLTIPRLGMTIASQLDWDQHKLIAGYFRIWGAASAEPNNDKLAKQLKELEEQIGAEALAQAWWLRRRNADYAREALHFAARFGFKTCHVAVEDNARTGPHLDEVAELRKLALELTADCRRENREPPRFTFFDGTDECGSLLTARAILDQRQPPPLPVRLTLFPSSPSPDQYFGLYESHSLEDGLLFLAKFLGFEYRGEADVQWLVCFGKQPQPDVFAQDPESVFNNLLLIPESLQGEESLFVADLQACNGGNPHLLRWLDVEAHLRLRGVSAWNTNFNALGFSAATMAVCMVGAPNYHELFQLLLERISDDYVYQSIVRQPIRRDCVERNVNPLDFGDLSEDEIQEFEKDASVTGRFTTIGQFAGLIDNLGARARKLLIVRYTFPWKRLFEVDVFFDHGDDQTAHPTPPQASAPAPVGGGPVSPALTGKSEA